MYEQWCYRFKFLEGIRLHWHWFHAGFGEIRFLKWRDVINSNSWLFGNIKWVSRRFTFIQANIFFLKLKSILTKIDSSCVKS